MNGWSVVRISYLQMSPNLGVQSLSVASTLTISEYSRPSSTWQTYDGSRNTGANSLISITVIWTVALQNTSHIQLSSVYEHLHFGEHINKSGGQMKWVGVKMPKNWVSLIVSSIWIDGLFNFLHREIPNMEHASSERTSSFVEVLSFPNNLREHSFYIPHKQG